MGTQSSRTAGGHHTGHSSYRGEEPVFEDLENFDHKGISNHMENDNGIGAEQ
jgi:hypothetical protein